MRKDKKPVINDLCCAIPFMDFDDRLTIVEDLQSRKARGFGVWGIEIDDDSKCVIYREKNRFYR